MKVLDYLESAKFAYDEMPDQKRKCPFCNRFLKFISKSKPRTILTLKGERPSILTTYRCENEKCFLYGSMCDPLSLAIPNIRIGKDLLKEITVLKYQKNMSIKAIKQELNKRCHLSIPESSLKRYANKAETIYLSNIRALIPRVIKKVDLIILNLDYMEPKSKRHKIFIAFEHESGLPLLFKILDVTNEVDIQSLIKTQLPELEDIETILVSDADTSLIFYRLKGEAETPHHLCLMHFTNFCFQIAKPLNDAAFSLIKDAVSTLWKAIKYEKDRSNTNCPEFDILAEHDTFGFLVSELISTIFEIKDIKGKMYNSVRIYPYLLQLLERFPHLDPEKTKISMDILFKAVEEVKTKLPKISEYIKILEEFSRELTTICSIIKDPALNRKETEERLLAYAASMQVPQASFSIIEGTPKKGRKRKKIPKIVDLWDALKDRVNKYATNLSVLKDTEYKDFTNNLCESSFSDERRSERRRLGTKNHSCHEYLNSIFYFHLSADIPLKLDLIQLSVYHKERFKRYFEVYKEGCRYYHRFHNKPKFISMKLKELERYVKVC